MSRPPRPRVGPAVASPAVATAAVAADAEQLDLRQLRHLTRNALQRILAQLWLVCDAAESPASQALLQEVEQRIGCSVAISDALFGLTQAPVSLAERLDSLARKTVELLAAPGQALQVETRVTGACPAPLHRPLLQMAHEAVANSVKHGFPEGRAGRLVLALDSDVAGTKLVVMDDGIGPDAARLPGEGLGLIEAVAQASGGRAALRRFYGETLMEAWVPHGHGGVG